MGADLKDGGTRASPARDTAALPSPASIAGLRIGLLGGSFNPAHRGHLFISREALKRLKLDRVWWLVSPRNPLKPATGLAPYKRRLDGARRLAGHPKIKVMDVEQKLGLHYTVDTLAALKRHLPHVHFVWFMGADCLAEIPSWKDWAKIFHTVPIAIFARPGYSTKALNGKAAERFRRFRVPEAEAQTLALREPPAWAFIESPEQDVSGTALRRQVRKQPRGHNS